MGAKVIHQAQLQLNVAPAATVWPNLRGVGVEIPSLFLGLGEC